MPHHRSAQQLALALVLLLAPSARAEERGHFVYAAHCAGCHGTDLEGQPDWMRRKPDGRLPAPPHDASGHTWHHSDDQLFRIVKEGPSAMMPGYESDMPGFGEVLSDDDIRAVLDYIKGTWPDRQRTIQKARSVSGSGG
jgi:mono/diheme cytochrome c family protein